LTTPLRVVLSLLHSIQVKKILELEDKGSGPECPLDKNTYQFSLIIQEGDLL
jgi:hypothetical protein